MSKLGLSRVVSLFRLKSWFRLLLLCVLVGIVAGLGALAFDRGLRLLEHYVLREWLFHAQPGAGAWCLALIPMLGGALAGLLAWKLAPEAVGHGTDAVIRAFHKGRGEIRARVPIIKGICSILTIGTGGSAGKEGPIAQIGAGCGSTLARLLGLSMPDRRILMLAGVAGGIGAIFKAPLGGALFAAEVLYREPDFEHDAVMPGVISSVVSYSVFTAVDGHDSILQFIDPRTGHPFLPTFPSEGGNMLVELLHYAILSLLCAAVAYLFVKGLRLIEKGIFNPLPLPRMTKPALGGLAMGLLVIGLMFAVSGVPTQPNLVLGAARPDHLMAGGHAYLQTVVDGALDPTTYDFWTSFKLAGFLSVVVIAKIAATGFTLGSGGSGGLLFPALFLGGVTGAAYAKLLRAFTAAGWVPGIMVMSPNERAGMILVGMGGVFAACTKTPIASLVMVSEITGSYGLSVPLMMTCASAYLLSHSFTMNEEQVPGIADSPAHRGEFLVNVLQDLKVSDAITKTSQVDKIPEDTPYLRVLEKIRGSSATVFPIVDENGGLIGLFSMNDLRQIMHEQSVSRLLVAGDLATADFAVVHMDTTLDAALRLFTQRNVEALPVVEGNAAEEEAKKGKPSTSRWKVLSLLSRRDLIAAYHRKLHDVQATDSKETDESHVFVDALTTAAEDPSSEPPRGEPPPAEDSSKR